MAATTIIQQGNILLSCESECRRESSQLVPDHVLGYIVSGSMAIEADGRREVHGEGSVGVLRRNLLGRFTKQPPAGGGIFKSISILLDQDLLLNFSREYNI